MKNEYGKVRLLDAVRMQNRIVSFYLRKDSCIYIAGKFQCRKTSWDVQNDDEHYGKNSRKSTGEENRSNSGRGGYAGYDVAWW